MLLVDDHEAIRQGLRHILDLETDIHVVGEASDGQEALAKIHSMSPDIILMDLRMPTMGGLDAMRLLKHKGLLQKVLVVSIYRQFFIQALELGVGGYLDKDVRRDELVGAIRRVHQGELVLGSTLWLSLGEAERTVEELRKMVESKRTPVDGGVIVELQLKPPMHPGQLLSFWARLQREQDTEVVDMEGTPASGMLLRFVTPSIRPFRDFLSGMSEVAEVREEAVFRDVGRPSQREIAVMSAKGSDLVFRIALKSQSTPGQTP